MKNRPRYNPALMPSVRLPSGQQARCVHHSEALSVYGEVQEYFERGLEVWPEEVVLNVGANIGPFAFEAAQRRHHRAKIYAFEPIPATFSVICYQAASASFTAFLEHDHRVLVNRAIFHNPNLACHHWRLRLPRLVLRQQQGWVVWAVLWGGRVTWPVETLLGQVDLLQIDTKGAEAPVPEDIAEADWPQIARVAVEMPDWRRDLPWVEGLLRSEGCEFQNSHFSYGSTTSSSAVLFAAQT